MKKALFLLFLMIAATTLLASDLDRARTLIEDRNPIEARKILEKTLKSESPEAESLVLLTHACNLMDDHEAGVRYGKQAIERLPKSSMAHHRYAEALRIKMTNVSKMKAMFTVGTYKKMLAKAIELDPKNVEARQEEIGFLINAPGIAGGDKDRARERIEDLAKISWKEAMVMKAELAFRDENDDEGARILREVLEKHPEEVGARFNLAFWYQRKERFIEADREFATIAEHDRPGLAMGAVYQAGRTRILGEYEPEAALAFLKDYVSRFPDPAPRIPSKSAAHWRMGNVYEQLEDYNSARTAYKTALALDSENQEAKQSLKKLGSR